ncbi:hypothetical protein BC941DRAFT_416723 [Chlamydoabsidia padenii]|nr:hypothetical protein BC941DRAFT_416723 [Chlamydoabsidia padenii]
MIGTSHLNKKQEKQDLQKIGALLRLPDNKRCFDCFANSPYFVDMTIQTFVCARCSGLIREVGHRVKSISTSKFSGPETTSLELGGNGMARRIWLRGFNGEMQPIESDNDVRLFMRQKYYEQRWLDKALWKEHDDKIRATIMELYTEDGTRRTDSVRRLSVKTSISSSSSSMIALPPPPISPSTSLKTPLSTGLTSAAHTLTLPKVQQSQQPLFDDIDLWTNPVPSNSTILTPTNVTTNTPRSLNNGSDKLTSPMAKPTMASPTSIQPLVPPLPMSSNATSPTSPTPQPLDPFAALRGLSF